MKLGSKTQFITAALVAFVFLGTYAKANPINGTINFGGLNSTSTYNNTGITSIAGVQVSGGATGSYAPVTVGDAVAFTTFNFTDSGVTPLWTFFDAGTGETFSFNAMSITVVTNSTTLLDVTGYGEAFITGAPDGIDTGFGTWTIQDTSASGGPTFVFQSSTTVPDSGSTALMIGLGLAGIGAGVLVQRRKLAKT